VKICGEEEALRLERASEAAIDEIRAFCEANAVDARFRRGGFLGTARSEAHVGAWEGVAGLSERLGAGPIFALLP
jgi:hypothetical protein